MAHFKNKRRAVVFSNVSTWLEKYFLCIFLLISVTIEYLLRKEKYRFIVHPMFDWIGFNWTSKSIENCNSQCCWVQLERIETSPYELTKYSLTSHSTENSKQTESCMSHTYIECLLIWVNRDFFFRFFAIFSRYVCR